MTKAAGNRGGGSGGGGGGKSKGKSSGQAAAPVTSLALQLKRLQVPQSALLTSVSERRRVSFLYDPSEAANMDSEAVYCLALNGLEQLKQIDARTFGSFERTLLNPSSVTFERAVQSERVNEQLGGELRRMLLSLAPYFMLKPAHKVLEWLVYRYHVHAYNLRELLMCVLPYHETAYFVRALQMLDLESNASASTHPHLALWSWLGENQRSGVPLAATSLATHIYSDLSFFAFVRHFVNEALALFAGENDESDETSDDDDEEEEGARQQQRANSLNFVLSFMTKTLMQSVKQLAASAATSASSSKRQEAFLALLVPMLFEGVKSHVVAYKQACYLVLALLFDKFKMNAATTSKALFAIAKGLATFRLGGGDTDDDDESQNERQSETSYDAESLECIRCAVLTMCLIVQSQTSDDPAAEQTAEDGDDDQLLSRACVKKLLKNLKGSGGGEQAESPLGRLFVQTLDALNETHRVDAFVARLFVRLVDALIEHDKANAAAAHDISLDLDANDDEAELRNKAHNPHFDLCLELFNRLNLARVDGLVHRLATRLFRLLIKQLE